MQASILIVSKNRKAELLKTLIILELLINKTDVEVLVFLDGCTDESTLLIDQFNWVMWFSCEKSIGASRARHGLYQKAKGQIFIGLDDDAHPLYSDFVSRINSIFKQYPNVGIIAFQEIKGIYDSDSQALNTVALSNEEYLTNEFIGCGFAIRKDVYEATNGFPVWIDIYGEESCVSIEVLAAGHDILYSNKIKVNHRVNLIERKKAGQNYFRFGKQLKNSTYYFLVYYPFPLGNIFKLYWHNFRKYALRDFNCFKIFFNVSIEVLWGIPKVLSYRKPVNVKVLDKMRKAKGLRF
ncbi:Glycosyltransferase, GT2 family [Flavobacterium omnivorum]|uniref:Glycosyltransferase, GT2 family n=1 Tax=Flavobacterium omnivorum TaxID=178355 RepID=A0A1G8CA50_9FLAO|nr:glycosyltransferase family A protein [Flavobacterium omnivorum]SDH42366.1 Glycosyltransferase, GT2 family [Flavobacterium omnivorum]